MKYDVVRLWYNKRKESINGACWNVLMYAFCDKIHPYKTAFRTTTTFYTKEDAEAYIKTLTFDTYRPK